jgi:hypothetical protein
VHPAITLARIAAQHLPLQSRRRRTRYEKTRRQKNDKRPTPYPIFVEAKMNGILEKTVSDFCLHGAAKF